jgi:hypothetical protein
MSAGHTLTSLCSRHMQVTHQLYEGVWRQWVADTSTLVERLPASLDGGTAAAQDMLTFERWLILLKVRPIYATCLV